MCFSVRNFDIVLVEKTIDLLIYIGIEKMFFI